MRSSLAQPGEANATETARAAAANSRCFTERMVIFPPCGSVLIACNYEGRAPRWKASERAHGDDTGIGLRHHGVAQRAAEGGHVDLEAVADARLDALGRTQDRCTEVVGVGVAGPAEHRIAEMIVLEIADRVRHVGLAAQELALPDDLVAAHDAGLAAHVRRQLAEQKFGPKRTLP